MSFAHEHTETLLYYHLPCKIWYV